MAAIGARRLIRKPRRPSTGINYLRDSGIAILKIYYTQIDCIINELAVCELVVSARTCTQPLSELATVSAGSGEVPAPISGRRRCVFGSWHLQTAHTSDHCESGGARRWRQPTSSLPWRMQRVPCRVHLSTWLVSVQGVVGAHLVANGRLLSAN